MLTLFGGVSIWMGDLKNIPLRITEALDRKFYFNANKCELSKVHILLACFMQTNIDAKVNKY